MYRRQSPWEARGPKNAEETSGLPGGKARPAPAPHQQDDNFIFIDGSLSTSDRRTRRAGWGVVRLTTNDHVQADRASLQEAWYGDVDGKQTAATVELAALWRALSLTTGDVTIVTDCALVANGWAKRQQLSATPGPHWRWWRRIHDAYQERQGGVKVVKCYSHLDETTATEL